MIDTIQKNFKVSSTQLLYYSLPGPFLDKLLTNENIVAFRCTTQVLVFIIMFCIISISVNFSTFLVIGKTSPATYQMLGHLKTCLVPAFNYIFRLCSYTPSQLCQGCSTHDTVTRAFLLPGDVANLLLTCDYQRNGLNGTI
ncbi:hypothetical protein Nepgr_021169 [Nepenthes gracilis]|uniref:Uncharacterized protein n=1 Tax=Nepenthes gracilis TaxID=150966 RepID=A0AAD3SXP0_NEPGR|nr:hypothetical protein Nepgr_021169 [Nepenthes gracilis]